MAAAARAASVALETAMPQSAFFSAGASPSLFVAGHTDNVIVFLQNIHDVKFMFGKHLGETVRFLDGLNHLC